MQEALGLVETVGISTAIEVADVMVKAANVSLLELENSRGSGYMTVKIVGDVGAVKAAVDAAKAAGIKYGNFVSASVIARPADGMASVFCNPKMTYDRKNGYNKNYNKPVEKKEEKKEAVPEVKPELKVEPKLDSKEEPKEPVKPEQKTEEKAEPKKETSKTSTKAKSDSAKKAGTTKASDKKGKS